MSMGDGGVACMPSQHVMERLPISETYCRGNGGGFSSKSSLQQLQRKQHEKKMVVKKEEFDFESSQKGELEKVDISISNSSSVNKVNDREVEKGEIVSEIVPKEEVEEGELASGKDWKIEIENGEFIPEILPKREVEKGEFIPGKWRRGELERGEFIPEKRQKWESERTEFPNGKRFGSELEKGEFVPEKWRKREFEKSEFGPGRRGQREELERGEFVPYKSRKEEFLKDDFCYSKGPNRDIERDEFATEKGRLFERERTSASTKFSEEDVYQRKELSRSGTEWSKKYPRWDPGLNRDTKTGLRAPTGESRSFKFETNDGKSYSKDYSSANWLKRQGADSGQNGRRYLGDFADHPNSKSRRIYEGNNHSEYLEKHQSRHSVERSYGTSSVSRLSSSSRYASKHSDSYRRAQDRHGPSPNYFEQSLHDRARHQDRHDGSPLSERSPNEQARYYNHRIRRSPHRSRHYDRREYSPGYMDSSPVRSRPYDRREHSPGYMDSSPVGRGRSLHVRARPHDRGERPPGYLENSPHDVNRSPHHDYRDRAPSYTERSPLDRDPSPYVQVRHPICRNHTPGQERSPLDRRQPHDHLEDNAIRKGREEGQISVGEQSHEDKLSSMDPAGRDSNEHSSSRQTQMNKSLDNDCGFVETSSNDLSHNEEKPQNMIVDCVDLLPQLSGAPEEVSMEEDMDISNTPPHVPIVDDTAFGTWFYLDHFGMEQGPSKLCNLKRLVDEGVLQSDHLIKHSGNDWWVTVEHAVSPLVTTNFQSIVSDTVSQLVSPPEAPGNLLEDVGDAGESVLEVDQEPPVTLPQQLSLSDDSGTASGSSENLHIDNRVDALLQGYAVISGRELETLGEALHMAFEHINWEKWGNSEGFAKSQPCTWEPYGHRRDEELNESLDNTSKELMETKSIAPCNKDYAYPSSDSSDWFFGRWSCKGGDWKRNDDANLDKSCRRKLVLNDGYPLCEMPKSGYKDPRWFKKDELYYPSRSRRLNLPSWAFSLTEERNDGNGTSRASQLKAPLALRGVKGTMLPVVRINACVVNNQASLVPEPRAIVRGNERHSSRYNRSGNDSRSLSAEGTSRSKRVSEPKCTAPIITPKDRLCLVDELQLHLGDWYYFDGAGHEHGPSSFVELQALVEKGTIQKHTSVFRKSDNIWVPVSYAALCSKASVYAQGQDVAPATDSSAAPSSQSEVSVDGVSNANASSFHHLHPQFIGYTRGKLHELVMKSYKSREFAAAINEVLDPWIHAKQVKKELESLQKFRRSEEDHNRKRARIVKDESEDDHDLEGHLQRVQMDDLLFDDLCGDATFVQEKSTGFETNTESWGLLNGYILARVFHFLRADMRSLTFSAATCRHWNEAVKFYRDITKQVDFSDSGPNCTDPMFRKIMHCYNNLKIASVVLIGCTNISAEVLEEILLCFPSISSIDIGGCIQFRELTRKFQNIKWINSRSAHESKISEDSYFKQRNFKQITERGHPFAKAYKGSSSHLNEFCDGDFLQHDSSLGGRNSTNRSFPQSFYKRKKLLDSRKSASVHSRDARIRHWLYRKSENGYKRIEEILALSLKMIMKENIFDFFIPKVAEIEEKMKNGYYNGQGLKSVKEDISRLCRDAIKAKKNRGDARDMTPIIVQFIHLATCLEANANKSSRERDELLKMLKDQSKKKNFKIMNDRKSSSRSNGTVYFNGGADHGDYVSDQELRRRLSKLNKKPLDSDNETSDDLDKSSEDTGVDSESTVSDTESDLVSGGRGSCRGDGYFMGDEALDSTTEDREWGARMTKASLVPPVTRKYEVIDRYVIIADEEEVQRKMRVSIPEDYAEKLKAQKYPEESDMEIPEVKDYKPRKELGDEVLEQEVYGIDPYTYNLLLDSMPEELYWTIEDKHSFIENTLLCALNMKVRHFTGTGNAPMKYPLQPVVEEILKNAEDGDKHLMKLCQSILKAMRSRPEDNYIAYRKGLGVVCNKEEGFGQDDFVVEFLGEVYPAWKWFEKQDGIRSFQKNNKDPAPEFYNIYLERPKGDRDGYDLVVVDAMHKANYASRICHSCDPNCEAKVTAVDGQYQIGVYTLKAIRHGEEITFDYNSVTESKEEYEASVCLCGNHICRGSYLNLTGEGAYQKVLMECHGILDRHGLMLEACESNFVSEEDYIDLGRAGLGSCLLDGLPVWLVAYAARLVRFINFERTQLPEEILRHNLEEKRKYFSEMFISDEKTEASEAEVQAEGVYNQRLQNLALTLDKVRYVMRCVYHDPKQAPAPLKKLTPEEVVSVLWKGEGSLVEELLECMAPYTDEQVLNDFKSDIHDNDPSGSDNLMGELQKSLLWLRDRVRGLRCTYQCRHDAAADLIHIYAYTKCFFRIQEYKTVTSPPVFISPLDLGPKYADKLGSSFMEYSKKYGENYCLGQLMYWHSQNNTDPDCCLLEARRGCLSLPEVSSFYVKANKPSLQLVYGPRAHRFMLSRIEKHPQRPWPKDKIWSFKSVSRVLGSPMLDAVVNKTSVDKDLLSWLKSRKPGFQANWDR
ncbi:Histone-lysine n-methyltransferase atxr3 [Thalictrum thalictroides]|uniref:Histone-lysine n-methyltransferase atxr3 n=1 Tax=Thalictrum thalictroides TaxID=46969 RepID=A0A7J6VMT5_THATH|nr:Histone-lysine n-methyltransferase atxr3 [Thalictrum thalictroides]